MRVSLALLLAEQSAQRCMPGLNQQPGFCCELRYHAKMVHFSNTIQPARLATVATIVTVSFSAAFMASAQARGGGHGYGRSFIGHGMHGARFVGGRHHGNDTYIKAASDERDKLLTTKLKSICRGC
jgi:hypothetical protein